MKTDKETKLYKAFQNGIKEGKQQTLKDVLKIIDDVIFDYEVIWKENNTEVIEFHREALKELRKRIEKELGEKK
jgi:hypothetical protein